MRCLFLLLLCVVLAAAQRDRLGFPTDAGIDVEESNDLPLVELRPAKQDGAAAQPNPEPAATKPTSKPTSKPSRKFARKVRRVLRRLGLLKDRLAATVVDALARDSMQLLRLDELMHTAALG